MNAHAADATRCPACGGTRDPTLPDGLCTRCLLLLALGPAPAGDPDTEPAAPDSRPRTVGRYRLLDEIDRGGVGVVYAAWHADLKRRVALKMLLPARGDARATLDRFRREAELMAGLDHPGILPIYEVGEHAGQPFLAMRYAEGGNLARRVAALRGRHRDAARLVAAIARAVAYAHGRGVLHRDLKPSNIVFDRDDAPLVTDFGLARLIAEDSTLTGSDALIGTPRYVAPEVVLGRAATLTAAADVYGLGAILYELLCGRAPFAELTPLQVLQQVATRRPVAPRQVDPSIAPALEAICLRCLEKRPQDRPASAAALAGALERWCDGGAPRAFARLRAATFGLPSRRRRATAAAALITLAALGAAGAWLALREPVPIPDFAAATRAVAVLPIAAQKNDASARDAARRLAERLQLPPALRLLPFERELAIFSAPQFPRNEIDGTNALGAFLAVDVVREHDGRFAVQATDLLREEQLYRGEFTTGDVARVADELSAALARKRAQPPPEARLPRGAAVGLVHAMRRLQPLWNWVQQPGPGDIDDAVAELKEASTQAPESGLLHVRLAQAYREREVFGGEAFWGDSAIDEAARARRLDPTLGLALQFLGGAYYRRGWVARSIEAHEQALALGNASANDELCIVRIATGKYAAGYRACREQQRFGSDDLSQQRFAAMALFAVGETDAGERALRVAMAHETADEVAAGEVDIAEQRHDWARCRLLAGRIADAAPGEGVLSTIRRCAVQQGDFAAALATVAVQRRVRASSRRLPNGNPLALREAILLAQMHQPERVPALLDEALPDLQAAIDSGSEYPTVLLRMAAAQRLRGDVDAAYATLERGFALGLNAGETYGRDIEFLPFRGDARFEKVRAASDERLAREGGEIVAMLDPAMRAPLPPAPQAADAAQADAYNLSFKDPAAPGL